MVIDRLHAVYENLEVIAHGFDAVFVPGIVFESSLSLGLVLEADEPAPAAFVVQATGPFAVGGVDLSLIYPELVLLEMAAELEAFTSISFPLRFDVLDAQASSWQI